MKRRRSFFKRHFIAIAVLVLVGVYSITNTLEKEMTLRQMMDESDAYLKEIQALETELDAYNRKLDEVDTLDYMEKNAREKLKMVRPDEIYFQVIYE